MSGFFERLFKSFKRNDIKKNELETPQFIDKSETEGNKILEEAKSLVINENPHKIVQEEKDETPGPSNAIEQRNSSTTIGGKRVQVKIPTPSFEVKSTINDQASKQTSSAKAQSLKPSNSIEKGNGGTVPSRRKVQAQVPISPSSVYIGLDFGTAFTKVAYEIAPSNEHRKYSVKFFSNKAIEDYLIPSVLYFDMDRAQLMLNSYSEAQRKLEYFKLLMVNDALPRNSILHSKRYDTVNDKEQICSAFYISCILSLAKAEIKKNPVARNISDSTKWYINMGIPIESLSEESQIHIFKTVLNVAWAYSNEHPNVDSVDLLEFDEFFSRHKADSSDFLNVYPELFAEVLLYQQDPNIPDGFYTVIDIGGGTADVAIFYKYKLQNSPSIVECLAKKVVWLGFDSLAAKVSSAETDIPIQQIKDFLNDRTIDFNNHYLTNLPQESIVDKTKLLLCRKGFRTAYGECIMLAKDMRPDEMHKNYSQNSVMRYFILGGAGDVAFYNQAVNYMKYVQLSASIPNAIEDDILRYLRNNISLEVKSDRLLISQMLAQPFEMIPEIVNMSWITPVKRIVNRGMSNEDLRELQEQLYPT